MLRLGFTMQSPRARLSRFRLRPISARHKRVKPSSQKETVRYVRREGARAGGVGRGGGGGGLGSEGSNSHKFERCPCLTDTLWRCHKYPETPSEHQSHRGRGACSLCCRVNLFRFVVTFCEFLLHSLRWKWIQSAAVSQLTSALSGLLCFIHKSGRL